MDALSINILTHFVQSTEKRLVLIFGPHGMTPIKAMGQSDEGAPVAIPHPNPTNTLLAEPIDLNSIVDEQVFVSMLSPFDAMKEVFEGKEDV